MAEDGKRATGLRRTDPRALADEAAAAADQSDAARRAKARANADAAAALARKRDAAEAPAREADLRRRREAADRAVKLHSAGNADALRRRAGLHATTPPLSSPPEIPKIQRPITVDVIRAQIDISTFGKEGTIKNFSDREKGELAVSIEKYLDPAIMARRGLSYDREAYLGVVSDVVGTRRNQGRPLSDNEIRVAVEISLEVRAPLKR